MSTFYESMVSRLANIEARAKALGSNMTQVCKATGVARVTYERWRQRPPKSVQLVDVLDAHVRTMEEAPQNSESMDKVYVAGPMTGLPQDNYPEFNRVSEWLRGQGLVVLNPAENRRPLDPTWLNWMRIAVPLLVQCDAVVLLNGWDKSRGAMIEYDLARALGLWIYALDPAGDGAEPSLTLVHQGGDDVPGRIA
jgi:hypothetical protein